MPWLHAGSYWCATVSSHHINKLCMILCFVKLYVRNTESDVQCHSRMYVEFLLRSSLSLAIQGKLYTPYLKSKCGATAVEVVGLRHTSSERTQG